MFVKGKSRELCPSHLNLDNIITQSDYAYKRYYKVFAGILIGKRFESKSIG